MAQGLDGSILVVDDDNLSRIRIHHLCFLNSTKWGEVHHRQTFQFMVGPDFPHP